MEQTLSGEDHAYHRSLPDLGLETESTRHLFQQMTLGFLAFLLALDSNLHAAPITYGSNLIDNPGAEIGTPLGGGFTDVSTAGGGSWIVTAGPPAPTGFAAVAYGTAGGYPLYTDPGPMPPATRGANLFFGGTNCAFSSAHQTMTGATPVIQGDIDAGLVTYDMNGWLGGYAWQADNAVLTLAFLDAFGTPIGAPVTFRSSDECHARQRYGIAKTTGNWHRTRGHTDFGCGADHDYGQSNSQ